MNIKSIRSSTRLVLGVVIVFGFYSRVGRAACPTNNPNCERSRHPPGAKIRSRVLTQPIPQSRVTVLDWTVTNCRLAWNGVGTGKTERQCHKDWKWRGAFPLSQCPSSERDGALCYSPCRTGFHGAGPVCWENCPAGYSDDGATCRKNAQIIGADNSKCPWYDKCGLVTARGCSTCPAGFHNDGCTCRKDVDIFAKKSFGRGAGSPMSCRPTEQQIGALCYESCPSTYEASGVFCNGTVDICENIPVQSPADYSKIRDFCFTLNMDSSVSPCIATTVKSDTEEHANQLAQCECTNCTVKNIDCSLYSSGGACK
jgi:hypothetical protein